MEKKVNKVLIEAKTPWSWGEWTTRFFILSEGRKIETRRQLEKIWPSH